VERARVLAPGEESTVEIICSPSSVLRLHQRQFLANLNSVLTQRRNATGFPQAAGRIIELSVIAP
jgi:hypothetical protein